jgi:hypothetical protein
VRESEVYFAVKNTHNVVSLFALPPFRLALQYNNIIMIRFFTLVSTQTLVSVTINVWLFFASSAIVEAGECLANDELEAVFAGDLVLPQT